MQTSRFNLAAVAAGLMLPVLVAMSAWAADGQAPYKSPAEAFAIGIEAYQQGDTSKALAPLEYAARQDDGPKLMAQYYLARIYSISGKPETDHGRAYRLFHKIAFEHAQTIDPDDPLVGFVAKSLITVAEYTRYGLPAIGLRPSLRAAERYLRYAATSFSDEDAQFRLAKLYLKSDGVEDPNFARHYLSVLAQRGHPGAQALLAEQHWHGGGIVAKDRKRALALITVAVDNASLADQIWIEDIYHDIYCGSSSGVRRNANGLVTVWRRHFPPALADRTRDKGAIGDLRPRVSRSCSNGEQVVTSRDLRPTTPEPNESALRRDRATGFTYGASSSIGAVRDVNAERVVPGR